MLYYGKDENQRYAMIRVKNQCWFSYHGKGENQRYTMVRVKTNVIPW